MDLPLIDAGARAEAEHGSWCPKLCSYACPVLAATGRDDAVPWGFHRTVVDLADQRLDATAARDLLAACTGCLSCQVPCVFEQDVPEQVRAGRAAVAAMDAPLSALDQAVRAVGEGRSPFDTPLPHGPPADADPAFVVLVGCRDPQSLVDAAAELFAAAGVPTQFVVPEGCCGATLRDLGATDAAEQAATALHAILPRVPVVLLDPHCRPVIEVGAARTAASAHPGSPRHVLEVLDELVAAGAVVFDDEDAGEITYHDPCLLARGPESAVDAPRRLLAAAGFRVVEPEGHGRRTVCSGAGLAFELVDEEAATSVAARRAGQLDTTGHTSVTACSGARRRLEEAGAQIQDLLTLLATRVRRHDP